MEDGSWKLGCQPRLFQVTSREAAGRSNGGGCNENGKDRTIEEIQRSRTRAGDCLEVGQCREEGSRLRSWEAWGARPEEEGEVQRRGRFARDGVWFSICCTQGIGSPSASKCWAKRWKCGCDHKKETWESADRMFRQAASCMAYSPGCRLEDLGPRHWLLECVHNMAAGFSQSEWASIEQVREGSRSHSVFCDLASKATFHHFCRMLLVTLTNCVAESEETAWGWENQAPLEAILETGYHTPFLGPALKIVKSTEPLLTQKSLWREGS